jgi:catechol 2,3-dioxygenase-like lactoylglutathione lyase family enzyme
VLSAAPPMVFIPTADPARARSFYEDTLRLDFIVDDGFALVFDLSGAMLRVTKIERFTPQPFTVLGWRVAGASAAVARLADRGVVFERFPGIAQDDLGIWHSPSGARVAWFKDTDGNLLSVTEDSPA